MRALSTIVTMETTQHSLPSAVDLRAPENSIAIVVLTHNRVHLLRQCVENVLLRTSTATREILIWDNGSRDGTRAYLDGLDHPRIRVVHHEVNIGQNAYARAFDMTEAPYLVDLDDDVVGAPRSWDAVLLGAFRRLPTIGFLAADLEDDPHDLATHYRYRIYEYASAEVNGLQILRGPTGGACAITSRELYRRAGGFRESKKDVFFLEDAAYVKDIRKLGLDAAVLADLKVHHTGGSYYADEPPEKREYWKQRNRKLERKELVKRFLFRLPFFRRLNARFGWCVAPS
jgi:GT2 family glycosyltransferase